MKNRAVSAPRRPQPMPPSRMGNQPPPPQQNSRPQQQQQQPQQPQQNNKHKISISDAIGLTTIRLSKVEQFISKFQENNDGFESNQGLYQFNDNSNNNTDVFEIINTRLNNIEQVVNNNKIQERLLKCENDLADTKDLLIKLVLKHEKLSTDITTRLNAHDAYILEQKTKCYINEKSQTDNLQIDYDATDNEEIVDDSVVIQPSDNTDTSSF
jgi:hypothetical protein